MEIPRLQKRVNRATVLAVIVDSFKPLGYQEPKKEPIEVSSLLVAENEDEAEAA